MNRGYKNERPEPECRVESATCIFSSAPRITENNPLPVVRGCPWFVVRRPRTCRTCRTKGFNENKPNWVNPFVIKWIGGNRAKQTQRVYRTSYQWLTAILGLIFGENVWMVQAFHQGFQNRGFRGDSIRRRLELPRTGTHGRGHTIARESPRNKPGMCTRINEIGSLPLHQGFGSR